MQEDTFHQRLKHLMHQYVRAVYTLCKKFPREELYGMTSQVRRAALSIILNYIEGFARRRLAVKLNFFETSYGSFKESEYIMFLAREEGYFTDEEYTSVKTLGNEIGAMLWKTIQGVEQDNQ
ncbi:MAG: four helix bundle protein [bacterium]|nr:four helix bundle protein [bacterium]